tara:strand:+ start:29 stop:172 length:144 start_codon:yes stop_codon:yes gene_type:complete
MHTYTLNTLQKLKMELEEYCDTNEKSLAMVARFIQIEENLVRLEDEC